jgi:L-threonylcarbamoyladenylate synthase
MARVETRLLEISPPEVRRESLAYAAEGLRAGRLVAFPTETVYGLGANAFDERAVRRIFTVKGRPPDNPLIVHVHSIAQAAELALSIPECFTELANEFWPGPLTLIVPRHDAVPDVVTAGLDTVALRMPDLPVARELIRAAGVPLAAPSANMSGRPSPTNADMVLRDFRGRIHAVINGGNCRVGIESTVLDLTTRVPTILRPGTVTREDIEDVVQAHVFHARPSPQPRSPGMKYQHYAPQTPVQLVLLGVADVHASMVRRVRRLHEQGLRVGLLAGRDFSDTGVEAFHPLGDGSPLAYARGLYAGLRALDAARVDVILCQGIAPQGVGLAVMNRLRKAATVVRRP